MADLLAAGIDVYTYTTLNVQHIDSLRDVVAQITGITIRETVPDPFVDEADEVVLVDISPEELLQRLQEGKVYVPDQAAQAVQKFFRKGNLTALRELTLRRLAEHVDDQVDAYMHERSIPGPWRATERILVAVDGNGMGERLVRAGRRLADEIKAEWMVAHVELPQQRSSPAKDQKRLRDTFHLAEQLGSDVVRQSGQSIVPTILEYAKAFNVTKIIIGKQPRPRWQELLRRSTADQLIRESSDIDVQVITPSPHHSNVWCEL